MVIKSISREISFPGASAALPCMDHFRKVPFLTPQQQNACCANPSKHNHPHKNLKRLTVRSVYLESLQDLSVYLGSARLDSLSKISMRLIKEAVNLPSEYMIRELQPSLMGGRQHSAQQVVLEINVVYNFSVCLMTVIKRYYMKNIQIMIYRGNLQMLRC